jgi:formylmethanofuran dehydrogenase subunit C
MTGWTLRAKYAPTLRVDLRGVTPLALTEQTVFEIERLPLACGRDLVPLAEFFHIEPRDDGRLVFAADLSRFDRVGWQMDGGQLIVEGAAGDYVGGGMSAGELTVHGDAGALAACEMAGGTLVIDGDVGDFAASTLPGSMDGMRGGTLVVKGHAGARFGDRMRRGTALVFGHVGDFVASRMVAGTIAVGGRVGAHAAFGMRCSPGWRGVPSNDISAIWPWAAAANGSSCVDRPARLGRPLCALKEGHEPSGRHLRAARRL